MYTGGEGEEEGGGHRFWTLQNSSRIPTKGLGYNLKSDNHKSEEKMCKRELKHSRKI